MHAAGQIAVLMGPTGTGKSAFALNVARARPTVIINADAMQMVADLRVITARPTVEEEAAAEHALYGVLPGEQATSVARWLVLVVPVIERAWVEGKLPLLVGGTGMYVKSLREGLANIPAIPDDIRAKVRTMGAPELYAALQAHGATADFKPGDTQRLARALEVIEATGKPIAYWQSQKHAPHFPDVQWHSAYLHMPRETLYGRLNRRFATMMQAGALEEVKALMAKKLPVDLPIMRAHGVPELMAYLRGEMDYPAAVAQAQQHTRNYAKRQMTWLRQQAADAEAIEVGGESKMQIFAAL